jgi:glycosyltransferase involved in cell wall biosynthesis
MKVAFDCHVPFSLAHGGMQIQIEQTLKSLRLLGVEAAPLAWWETSVSPQIVHFFGKPSPVYASWVRQKNIKLVVSDLLTAQGSRTAWQRLPFRLVCLADRFLGGRIRTKLGWTLYESADCCVCLTPWEAFLVRNMYGARDARIEVVPNGVEDVFLHADAKAVREDHLITTITITPRKRAVEMVEAAALAKVKLKIIGKPYQENDPYFSRFLESVTKAKPWVEYAGPIEDRAKLAEEYRKAAGFMLLSAMESQSLSALEAAGCGCPLLLTDLPWAKFSFGDQATFVPLASPARTAAYLKKFFTNLSGSPRAPKVLSWREVGERLKKIYLETINSR